MSGPYTFGSRTAIFLAAALPLTWINRVAERQSPYRERAGYNQPSIQEPWE
jgi:hypothetical protein